MKTVKNLTRLSFVIIFVFSATIINLAQEQKPAPENVEVQQAKTGSNPSEVSKTNPEHKAKRRKIPDWSAGCIRGNGL
jgi:hypothetical protein